MTNAEKYLKDGVDLKELSRELFNYIVNNDTAMLIKIREFFEKPCKLTLTEDERVILRNIKDYKYIGRGMNKRIIAGELYISKYSSKDYDFDDTEWIFFEPYEHLFRNISSRRRIRDRGVVEMIEELHKNKFIKGDYLPSPQQIVEKMNEIIVEVNNLERFVQETMADMVLYGTKEIKYINGKILPDEVMKELLGDEK